MNKTRNASLAKFSSFISWALVAGVGGLFVAFITFINAGDSTAFALGVFLAYASSTAIGLAVVGAFLRQTAKVVVEGMGGNLREFDSSAANVSFTSDKASPAKSNGYSLEHQAHLESLSFFQQAQWEDAGEPDLSDWDGSITFTTWLRAQRDK